MDRRTFLKAAGAAAVVGASGGVLGRAAADAQPEAAVNTFNNAPGQRMKVGCQRWGSSDKHLPFLKRFGVEAVCASPAATGDDRIWTVDSCRQRIAEVEKHGLQLAAMYWGVPIDVLIPAKRDAAIERCRKQLTIAGQAGIPALQYNLHVRSWRARTGKEEGRGGSSYGAWDLSKVERQKGKPDIAPVDEQEMWERITYFLKNTVPAATEAKVAMSCHPPDPPMPRDNEFKIAQVLDTVEGLQRFVQIADSPYHGVLFCQGCIWEMLPKNRKPEGLYEAIRWFGTRRKIVGVHFRNLRGGREKFVETWHDEGEIDMPRAALEYRKAGYTGMLMPDHVPGHADDGEGLLHFGWAYGYIKGVIQSVYSLT